LEVPPLSSMKDINVKYRQKAKKFHSDKGGDDEEMARINWAYGVLRDYVNNFKFTFSEDEILKQYPGEFLKKFRV